MPDDSMIAQQTRPHALVLDRVLAAPRAAIWRCWTEPALLKRWFVPVPWTVPDAALDLRPGGAFRIVMRSPDGEDHPNCGAWLEIDPGRRLVFTDGWGRCADQLETLARSLA